jgi:hypothetical protein
MSGSGKINFRLQELDSVLAAPPAAAAARATQLQQESPASGHIVDIVNQLVDIANHHA